MNFQIRVAFHYSFSFYTLPSWLQLRLFLEDFSISSTNPNTSKWLLVNLCISTPTQFVKDFFKKGFLKFHVNPDQTSLKSIQSCRLLFFQNLNVRSLLWNFQNFQESCLHAHWCLIILPGFFARNII